MNRRKFLSATAIIVAAACAVAFAVHTAWFKDVARRRAVVFLAERLGGDVGIDELEYQLWRGHVQVAGVRWSAENGGVTIRADAVGLELSWLRLSSVTVDAAEVRVGGDEGESSDAAAVSIPEWLFDVAVELTSGRLVTDAVELDGVELRLDPGGGRWNGRASARSVGLAYGDELVNLESLRTQFVVEPNRVEILEARLERGSSYIDGTATLDELMSAAPLSYRSKPHLRDRKFVRS